MAKELKLWNTHRVEACRKHGDAIWSAVGPRDFVSIFAAAHSRADLRRLIEEYCGRDPGDAELKHWCLAPSWGKQMENVTPERGLWLRQDSAGAIAIRLV